MKNRLNLLGLLDSTEAVILIETTFEGIEADLNDNNSTFTYTHLKTQLSILDKLYKMYVFYFYGRSNDTYLKIKYQHLKRELNYKIDNLE